MDYFSSDCYHFNDYEYIYADLKKIVIYLRNMGDLNSKYDY